MPSRLICMRSCAVLLLTFVACLGRSAENSPPAPVPDRHKESAWLLQENRTYDESFVNRKDVFNKDPYIWAYTEAFAKDFHMPDRWIDKGLKGADAVAFRTDPQFPLCGWGGNPESCQEGKDCLIELYFNRDRHPLPWNEKLRWTDLQANRTSAWILGSMKPMNRYASNSDFLKPPFVDPATNEELGWWYVHGEKGASGGGPIWRAYDRSIFEGYSFLALGTGCRFRDIAGLELYSSKLSEPEVRIFHTVEFSPQWRKRVKVLIEKADAEESEFFKKQFEQLKVRSN